MCRCPLSIHRDMYYTRHVLHKTWITPSRSPPLSVLKPSDTSGARKIRSRAPHNPPPPVRSSKRSCNVHPHFLAVHTSRSHRLSWASRSKAHSTMILRHPTFKNTANGCRILCGRWTRHGSSSLALFLRCDPR